MTNKQKELVEEITTEFKALPFKERMNIVADGTIGVVEPYLDQYPERQDEVDEILELDTDASVAVEDQFADDYDQEAVDKAYDEKYSIRSD